jgi:hypothetical protein
MQSRGRLVSRVSMFTRPSTRPVTRLRISVFTRGLATATTTATKAKEVLPLKGIKVLDMTRVLAGVSSFFLSFFIFVLHLLALLFFLSFLAFIAVR